MPNKTFALAEVKSADTDNPNGAFEAILSAPTLDRDGEIVDAHAFDPLPPSVVVHAFHDFTDPIGRGVPVYEGDTLYLRGVFASTPRAQEIRSLVAEGVIASMSVGFMAAKMVTKDGVPHLTRAEILEGSFVSIPSNREAAVLAVKEYAAKAGARNSTSDLARLQAAHDVMVELGAKCAAVETNAVSTDVVETTDTEPEVNAAAPAPAEPSADVTVARARAAIVAAQAQMLLSTR